jgi:hypothetical protein
MADTYNEMYNNNLDVVKSIMKINKKIREDIDPSEIRSLETTKLLNEFILKTEGNITTLFNSIKEFDSRLENVINSIHLIRNIVRNNNKSSSDSESLIEAKE